MGAGGSLGLRQGSTSHGHRAGFRKFGEMYQAAVPKPKTTIEDQAADGDRVATRVTYHATHKGDLQGIPPTGKEVHVNAIGITQHNGGLIVQRWDIFDQ